jgi:hypothetical protein
MSDTADIANRPSRMLEAGLLFSIAIDAVRAIKVEPRTGGQRSALVGVVFSVIALESFVNESASPFSTWMWTFSRGEPSFE